MPVILTQDNDVKERLSFAYLTAVAARAGCQITEPRVDRNAIDATISAIRGTNVKLDVQLKATSAPKFNGGDLVFDLDVPTYDKLREPMVQTPALLVVLALSDKPAEWLVSDINELVLKKCAYWVNLAGEPASTNAQTQRVRLPVKQILTSDTLVSLFETMDANMRKGVAAL
jgi:hypothetical protein